MTDPEKVDYTILDIPEVLMFLFHPRPEGGYFEDGHMGLDILIPVEENIALGARLHLKDTSFPNILFFHGNGEIVADYNDLGPLYNEMGINFLPVDYRGYGRSNGNPSVSNMMRDGHMVFKYVKKWLAEQNYTGPLLVMGRSLGSASALELASCYRDDIAALIIESGFALAAPLLRLLGIHADAIGFREEQGFRNVDKIKNFNRPTLIIHAEYDHIIPFTDGQMLYESSSARQKTFLKIPGANHNDIFLKGLPAYLDGIRELIKSI